MATPRLHEDASGIAILTASAASAIAGYVGSAGLTETEAHALRVNLNKTHEDAYVLQNSREIVGLAGVAVAVPSATGSPFAAVKLASPTGRLVANLDRVADALGPPRSESAICSNAVGSGADPCAKASLAVYGVIETSVVVSFYRNG